MFYDMPHLTDEELNYELSEYNESGYGDIPNWIRQEIEARNLTWPKRKPTETEKLETEDDAWQHRISHNEHTTRDFVDKYKHGKYFKVR
jgi:hypothetical protein